MSRRFGFWFMLVSLLLFQSCGNGDGWIVYNEVEIANDWNQEDVLKLTLTPSDKTSSDIYLSITHSPEFKYENIYLKYILSQQGKVLAENKVSIPLMSEDGLWTGDKKGSDFSSKQLIGNFDLTRPISIEIQQFSRDAKLDGVVAIGAGVM